MSYEIVRGDLGPPMPITLSVNGTAIDASGASTVQLHWLKPDGSTYLSTLTPVNAAQGQYQMNWSAGDTDVAGPYQGQVIVTTSGVPETFPSDGTKIIWWVTPQVGDLCPSGC